MNHWQQKFEQFDAEHPEVYEEFKRQAERLLARGFRHYSAQTIFSVMRFHSDVDGRPDEPFKLNQNYHAYYGRKLMAEDARFTGFFELRRLRGEVAA